MADNYRIVTGAIFDRFYRGCIIYWQDRMIAMPEHVIALYERIAQSPCAVDADEAGLSELLRIGLVIPATARADREHST